jgi:hypothetical protein
MVALKYKELWQVEQAFRDVKSILETRPVFHQKDATIRGHIFCSFLALVLRKELESRLQKSGHAFEWSDIKQDLQALQEITITERDKTLAVRTECLAFAEKFSRSRGGCPSHDSRSRIDSICLSKNQNMVPRTFLEYLSIQHH